MVRREQSDSPFISQKSPGNNVKRVCFSYRDSRRNKNGQDSMELL